MNICFIEGDMSRRGGTERMTALLANQLAETDTVWVISLYMNEKRIFFPLNENVKHLHIKNLKKKSGIIQQIYRIHTFLKGEDIDWVINVDIGTCIYGIPAAMGTKAKVITWEHSNYYNNWGSRLFPYVRKYAAKHSDAMVVLTKKDKENYRKNITCKKPIYVIPNPAQKHEFTYNSDSKVILSAGLLLPIKGYDKAIRVAAEVLPQYPDWKWIVCGEGPEREHMESLIAEKNLKNKFILKGSVSDMDEQYQHAAMYVMTSQMEGMPMVLLEAKSWGLPIISFDIMTGPSDIVTDGVNGYLVQKDNFEELVDRLKELIESEEKRRAFSQATQYDMERFDLYKIVEKWQEVMKI